jgi:hypothetical protein
VRRLALAAAFVFTSGCSHTEVGSGNASATSGTVVTSGTAGLNVTTSSGAAALAIVLTLGAIDYARNPQPFPSPSALISPASPPAPELAVNRRISEQDCSKPLADPYANLKCR